MKMFTETCRVLRAAGFMHTGSLLRRAPCQERCASKGGLCQAARLSAIESAKMPSKCIAALRSV